MLFFNPNIIYLNFFHKIDNSAKNISIAAEYNFSLPCGHQISTDPKFKNCANLCLNAYALHSVVKITYL